MRRSATVLLAGSYCASALADAGNSQSPTSMPSGLLIGLLIAYLSRKGRIGGWLLYYYMQLVLGAVVTAAVWGMGNLSLFLPSAWDELSRYVWYVLSTVPCLLVFVVQFFVAVALLFRRNANVLRWLRLTLLASVLVNGAALAIDFAYFPEGAALFLDAYTLFFTVIWCFYFYKSTRVQGVFVDHDWTYLAG